MSASRTSETQVAARYARALFALAEKESALDAVASDLGTLAAAIRADVAATKLLAHPLLPREAKAAAMQVLLSEKKAHALTQKTVALMARAGRVTAIPALADVFIALLDAAQGRANAVVTSAVALSKKDEATIAQALKDALGKPVQLQLQIDPSLIGGLKVKLGSRELDMSISGRLERISRALKAA